MLKQFPLFLLGLGATLATIPTQAALIQILYEDFQGVTGLTTSTTTKTLAAAGSTVSSNTRAFGGEATEDAVNIRRWDNAIDGSTSSPNANTFEDFFNGSPNQFLVLGDNTGNLGGEPNGPATMQVDFALDPLPSGTLGLEVFFRYAFDANNPNNNDDFQVALVLQDNSLFNLLNLTQPVSCRSGSGNCPAGLTRASLGFDIPIGTFSASPIALRFFLQENNNGGSSAAGIDDIAVFARIPEPNLLALVGVGMMGLGWQLKRGVKKLDTFTIPKSSTGGCAG